KDLGVGPFGIEAQRVLRLESGHLIVGQDTDGLTQAYSAGLDWAVKLDKEDFVGKPELLWQQQKQAGPRLVPLQPVDPTVVPTEASQIIRDNGEIVGRITSSRHSPTLNRSICLAQVDISLSEPGTVVNVRLPDKSTIQAKIMAQMSAVDPEGTRLDNDTVPQSMITFAKPVARGPVALGAATTQIGDWEVSAQPSSAALTLEDQSALAKIEVRSRANGT